ncbi:MAG: zinc-binding dehydrogenase, partial [Alphaproteobacteria bacterium]|nr:zinc-binding dehydrogenase [Alphaproteobacteria bacterium]
MKAWRLDGLGGALTLEDVPMPEVRPGSVRVQIEAIPLLSYMKRYVDGRLPYHPPQGAFTPGTNGVGVIEAVGRDVWHLKPGQRVVLSPHFVAGENVEDPAQILIGLTAFGPRSAAVQADWRDGSLAEYALMPVATVTPVEGLEAIDAAQLAVLNRCIVPFGGLLRGRLVAGETLVVNGATGAFGTAAVLLGVAMGAARVVAAGRSAASLEAVAKAAGERVAPVRLTGDVQADAASLRDAMGGGADMAFDMVGQAGDANATLASLNSLRRGGRLVLMGSMTAPLPLNYSDVMRNDWEIIGQFMYPASAFRRLLGLLRSGLLEISPIRPVCFPLGSLSEAMERAE